MSTVNIHDLARNGKLSKLQQELANNPSRIEEKDSKVCENILFLFIYFI
jgi:hypothetical protein